VVCMCISFVRGSHQSCTRWDCTDIFTRRYTLWHALPLSQPQIGSVAANTTILSTSQQLGVTLSKRLHPPATNATAM
jgi:hypothetical protein